MPHRRSAPGPAFTLKTIPWERVGVADGRYERPPALATYRPMQYHPGQRRREHPHVSMHGMKVPPMTDRPRVLAIAEACNPEWVSVPLVGWSLVRALKAVADVHIVTQIRNRDALLRAGLVEHEDFTALDSEALAAPLWRAAEVLRLGQGKGWTTVQALAALAYPYFEYLLWQAFADRLRAGEFDIVHRITPLTPTISSPVAPKCARLGVPFVLGPINGGVRWPKEFAVERRREREVLSYVRDAYKVLPGRRRTLAGASAILVGARSAENDIPLRFREKCVYLPENGIDPEKFSLRAAAIEGPARACFIGRMVPLKGTDMLIDAAAPLLKSGRLKLDMIGDGPMLPELRAQAERLGVGEAVAFHGWMEHADVQKIAARCTIFAFPSIREFGGGAVLEAMALGLVPVVVDYAGPSELVTGETGVKVPLGTRDEIVAGFTSALGRLVDSPGEVREMGENARRRVERFFTWQRKAEQVAEVYDWVLGKASKPEFFDRTSEAV